MGLITPVQQGQIRQSRVLVCGLGGMGGVCAEVLVRLGVGRLVLADHDRFEITNFNRQIHANQESVGRNKAEVLAEAFRKINPKLQAVVYSDGVTRDNVADLLEQADIVVNGMDCMKSSLILERTARRMNRPMIDAWLTPYASVFVMKREDPHWEEYLGLPTLGVDLDGITPTLCRDAVEKEVSYTFSHGSPYRYVDRETVRGVVENRIPRPSLAPVVWLSGVLMANEVFKLMAGYPTTNHVGIIYDQYEHRLLLREDRRGENAP
jgi:hypothetical protein